MHLPGSVLSNVEGSELESSSLHSIHTPVLTSTVQRQPDKAPGKPTTTESDIGSGITELGSEDEFSSGYVLSSTLLQYLISLFQRFGNHLQAPAECWKWPQVNSFLSVCRQSLFI